MPRLIEDNFTPTEAVIGEKVVWVVPFKDIYEAPTVDAIPVEWINKYANEHRAYIHAFAEMVVCWNERKDDDTDRMDNQP